MKVIIIILKFSFRFLNFLCRLVSSNHEKKTDIYFQKLVTILARPRQMNEKREPI